MASTAQSDLIQLFQAAAVFHEPPRRMLLRLPHSSVCVSDYLFPGESPYDSADSVLEILGFRPNIEFMDDEIELVAAPRPTPKVRSGYSNSLYSRARL